jgi:hypothetical protein
MSSMQFNVEQPMKIVSIQMNDFVTCVVATPKGILASILQLFGANSTSFFQVDADGARLKKCKFGSEEEIFIPFAHISATFYHHAKPLWALIVGVLILITGIGTLWETGGEGVGVIVTATSSFFFLLYFFGSQAVAIGIVADAGTTEQLKVSANKEEIQRLKEVKARIDEMILGEKPLI